MTTEVTIPWSSWVRVSLWFFLQAASHTHCLLYNFVSQGRSHSDPNRNVYDQEWGDLGTGCLVCVCGGGAWVLQQRMAFECPLFMLLLPSAILIFWKKNICGQYFLPIKSLALVSTPKWCLTFKWWCRHCHRLLWTTSLATTLGVHEMRRQLCHFIISPPAPLSFFKGKWPGLISSLTINYWLFSKIKFTSPEQWPLWRILNHHWRSRKQFQKRNCVLGLGSDSECFWHKRSLASPADCLEGAMFMWKHTSQYIC